MNLEEIVQRTTELDKLARIAVHLLSDSALDKLIDDAIKILSSDGQMIEDFIVLLVVTKRIDMDKYLRMSSEGGN